MTAGRHSTGTFDGGELLDPAAAGLTPGAGCTHVARPLGVAKRGHLKRGHH